MVIARFYDRRTGVRVTLRGSFENVMRELRAWCPGGKVAEICRAAGRSQ